MFGRDPAQTVGMSRAILVGRANDESNWGFTSVLVRGTRALPRDPRSAIRSGDFYTFRVLIGGTLDEGRAFTSSNIGWTRRDHEDWIDTANTDAGAVIATYPWPATADEFTPADRPERSSPTRASSGQQPLASKQASAAAGLRR